MADKKKLTLCLVCTAAALALMALSMVLPAQFMLWAALAVTMMIPVGEECPLPAGLGVWVAASVAALLLPMLESAMLFALFGFYPMMYSRIEALQIRSLRAGMRLLIILCSSAALFMLLSYFFGELLQEIGADMDGILILFLLAACALYFLLVNFLCKQGTALWRDTLRPRFFGD